MLSRTNQTPTRAGGHDTYRVAVPDLESGMILTLPGRHQGVRTVGRYEVNGRAYYRINGTSVYGSDSFVDVLASSAPQFGRVSEPPAPRLSEEGPHVFIAWECGCTMLTPTGPAGEPVPFTCPEHGAARLAPPEPAHRVAGMPLGRLDKTATVALGLADGSRS